MTPWDSGTLVEPSMTSEMEKCIHPISRSFVMTHHIYIYTHTLVPVPLYVQFGAVVGNAACWARMRLVCCVMPTVRYATGQCSAMCIGCSFVRRVQTIRSYPPIPSFQCSWSIEILEFFIPFHCLGCGVRDPRPLPPLYITSGSLKY